MSRSVVGTKFNGAFEFPFSNIPVPKPEHVNEANDSVCLTKILVDLQGFQRFASEF